MTDDLDTEQVSIFMGKDFVLSWREQPGPVFDIVRKRLQVTGGVTRSAGVDYLLYALLDAVIDSYFPVLEKLGEVLDELDDRVEVAFRSHAHSRHGATSATMCGRCGGSCGRCATRSTTWCAVRRRRFRQDTLIHLRDCHDHAVQIMDALENYRDAGSRPARLLHLRDQQPAERDHEGADDHLDDLHAAVVHRGRVRHELRHAGVRVEHAGTALAVRLCGFAGADGGGRDRQLVYFRRKGWLGGPRSRPRPPDEDARI